MMAQSPMQEFLLEHETPSEQSLSRGVVPSTQEIPTPYWSHTLAPSDHGARARLEAAGGQLGKGSTHGHQLTVGALLDDLDRALDHPPRSL